MSRLRIIVLGRAAFLTYDKHWNYTLLALLLKADHRSCCAAPCGPRYIGLRQPPRCPPSPGAACTTALQTSLPACLRRAPLTGELPRTPEPVRDLAQPRG